MARLKKGKKNASTSRSSSEVNDVAETAQACASSQITVEGTEVYASSPTTVEGTDNGENAKEATKIEEDGTEIMHSEVTALEEKDNGGNAAEKQEEDDNCVGKEKNGGDDVEGEVNGTNAADKQEDDGDYVDKEENGVEGEVSGSNAADKQEDDGDYVDKEENGENAVEGEVNRSNGADKQEEDGDYVDKENDVENAIEGEINGGNATEKQEEKGNCVDEENTGENALEVEVSGGDAAEKQEEKGNCVDEENTGENALEVEVSGGDAAEKQEEKGNCIDEQNNGGNADEYEEKSEECMVEQEENDQRDAMEEKEIVGLNKGNGADESEDKQHVVEEEKGEENDKEQQVGRLEENLEELNIRSRNRIKRKKGATGPAGKVASQGGKEPELRRRKKVKRIENDTKQDSQNQGSGACEMDSNKENPVDGDKVKEKVATDMENGGENVKKEDGKEVGESSKKREINLKKLKRRHDVGERASEKVTSKGQGSGGPSDKNKSSKKAETKGMIFMCSSKTKEDCFHYKVLGLPAGKKNIVEKIYKGMKLFLYDVDLKLLYGIYKAAGRGGYNIEPKAFNSQFPSQVRFKVSEDCLPLPEEKFRKVIKDNYYTRTKFDCQLNLEQVNNLRKLFVTTGKFTRSKKLVKSARAETKKLDRNRIRRREEVRRPPLREEVRRPRPRDEVRRPPPRDELTHPPARDELRRPLLRDEVRRPAFRDESRQHVRLLVRNSPVALVPQLPSLPPRTTSSSYAYDRTVQREAYRLEPPVETRRSYSPSRLLDLQDTLRQEPRTELRRIYRQEQGLEHHDAYRREPLLELRDPFRREPLLEQRDSFRREPLLEHRDLYRREPLLEHSDSYRRERGEPLFELGTSYRQGTLLDHRDLYSQDARLEQLDRRLPNLEATHRREVDGRDLHNSYREQHPSYGDRVYSTSRQPAYNQRVDMQGEGHSAAYRSTKGLLSEYYSRRPAY